MLTFSQLDFQDLRERFGVTVRNQSFLPVPRLTVTPPGWLQEFLADVPFVPAIAKSAKAVSEAIIYPMLAAVRKQFNNEVGLFSGEPLSAAGLVGVCDFVFSANPNSYEARPPIMVLVEAKRQDLLKAIPQCVGEMIAARQLNEDADLSFPAIYGCVTTGQQWQFLQLANTIASVDPQLFFYPEVDAILGAFSWVINQFKA